MIYWSFTGNMWILLIVENKKWVGLTHGSNNLGDTTWCSTNNYIFVFSQNAGEFLLIRILILKYNIKSDSFYSYRLKFTNKINIDFFSYHEHSSIGSCLKLVQWIIIDLDDSNLIDWRLPALCIEKVLEWCITVGEELRDRYNESWSEYIHDSKCEEYNDSPYRENVFEIFEKLHRIVINRIPIEILTLSFLLCKNLLSLPSFEKKSSERSPSEVYSSSLSWPSSLEWRMRRMEVSLAKWWTSCSRAIELVSLEGRGTILVMELWTMRQSSETIPPLPIRKWHSRTSHVHSISVSMDSIRVGISSADNKKPQNLILRFFWYVPYTMLALRAFHGGSTSLRTSFTAWKACVFIFQIASLNHSWFSLNSVRSLDTVSSLASMRSNRVFKLTTFDFSVPTSNCSVPTSDFSVPTSDFSIPTSVCSTPTVDWIPARAQRTVCWNSWSVILLYKLWIQLDWLYRLFPRRQMENSRHDCKKILSYTIKSIPFLHNFSMRKTPLIITLLLVGIVSTYALVVNLFPDTANFPRIPLGNGTIGGIIANILWVSDLANYSADGTVGNTNMLSGMTSTGYLRSSGNCGATKVWTSLGAGMPTCADKNAVLASMGTVNTLSWTVTAYHTDGTFETLTSGTGILVGDIIKTNPGTTVTIAFADLSILRVGEDSTVSLDVGTLWSQSLAYAILENGSLWGRVLSETGGYYIGRDDLIVGVRGTSVSFRQSNPTVSVASIGSHWKINKTQSWGIGELNIVQSSTNGTVGTVICKDALWSHEFPIGTGSTIQFWSMITSCSLALITVDPSIANTYAKPDIAKNVIADLDYMSGVLASTIGITATQRTKIDTEFTRSRPTTLWERGAICPIPGNGLARIFWDSLMRTNIDTCQETDVLAVADYSDNATRTRLFLSSGTILMENTWWMSTLSQPNIGYTGAIIGSLLNWDWKISWVIHTPNPNATQYLMVISWSTDILKLYTNYNGGSWQFKLYIKTDSRSGGHFDSGTVLPNTDYHFNLKKSNDNYDLEVVGIWTKDCNSCSLGSIGWLYIGRHTSSFASTYWQNWWWKITRLKISQ